MRDNQPQQNHTVTPPKLPFVYQVFAPCAVRVFDSLEKGLTDVSCCFDI